MKNQHNLLNKKQIRGIISLWVDNEDELNYWYNTIDAEGLFRYVPDTTVGRFRKPVQMLNLGEKITILRIRLIILEMEKLCMHKILEQTRADAFKMMLQDKNGYTLIHNIITVLREKRLGI